MPTRRGLQGQWLGQLGGVVVGGEAAGESRLIGHVIADTGQFSNLMKSVGGPTLSTRHGRARCVRRYRH